MAARKKAAKGTKKASKLEKPIARANEVVHPGFILEDYRWRHRMRVTDLSNESGVSRQRIYEVLRGDRSINVEMGLRFAKLFSTTPAFWLDAQRAFDVQEAMRDYKADIARIRPLGEPSVREIAWRRGR